MSNTARIAATAANTLTKPLNVEDVFSTYLYTGTGSTQTITNNIDLSGEGGLVWMKARSTAESHCLQDTDGTGVGNVLLTNSTSQMIAVSGTHLSAFNSNGFSIGTSTDINRSGTTMASWTFRKAPKFFDVVTYTGDGTSSRAISHSLGSTPGCIIIKRTDASAAWTIFHRGLSGGITGSRILFDTSAATSGSNITAVDDSTFTVISTGTNASGGTYVAYLFAHNDGDGDFGDGTQDIIKCGSFTSTSGTDEIDLGFEPQWILIKRADASNSWVLVDEMRGNPVGSAAKYLEPNGSFAESTLTGWTTPTPTGFTNSYPLSGAEFIYIAIRRGPMAVPTDATDVFFMDVDGNTGDPAFRTTDYVDFSMIRRPSSIEPFRASSRLTGSTFLDTSTTAAEDSSNTNYVYDYNNGFGGWTTLSSGYQAWMWKRAPNFFDVVAYTGSNTAGTLTVNHNLGVKPELIIAKSRTSGTQHWNVLYGFTSTGEKYFANIGTSAAAASGAEVTYGSGLLNSEPTDSAFVVRTDTGIGRGQDYIAYLFASLDGVSKVGSYTSDGTDGKVIDCGFTSGARFVLIKGASVATNWLLWDSERGIVAGNDPFLELNTTDAEDTGTDYIDPHSSGFIVNSGMNFGTNTFIFYAIA